MQTNIDFGKLPDFDIHGTSEEKKEQLTLIARMHFEKYVPLACHCITSFPTKTGTTRRFESDGLMLSCLRTNIVSRRGLMAC